MLHLKAHQNQPYGSERRCCEICGLMIWGNKIKDGHEVTDNKEVYYSNSNNCLSQGFEICWTCDGRGCPVCNPIPTQKRTPVPEGCEECEGCPDCLEDVKSAKIC